MDLMACIKAQLANFLSVEQIAQIQGYLGELVDQRAVQGVIDKYKAMLDNEITAEDAGEAAGAIEAAQKKEIEKTINPDHNVQEARKSVKYTEQKIIETKYTNPANLRDVDYSTQINYPERYGHIDSNKNWFVVDKAENYAEAVSSSGSLFHIDKDGNVSIHITGSLKLIVDKDIAIEGRANMDKIIRGSSYTHIGGNKSLMVDGPVDNTLMSSLTDKVSSERTYSTGSTFNNTVGAAFVTKAGSISTSAAGGASSSSGGGFTFTGDTTQTGNISVNGSISASGTIMDAGGNSNHHSH